MTRDDYPDAPDVGDYVHGYIQRPGPAVEKVRGLVVDKRPASEDEKVYLGPLQGNFKHMKDDIEIMIHVLREDGSLLWVHAHSTEVISESQ